MSITVNGPTGTVVITKDFCLQRAANLLISAEANIINNANRGVENAYLAAGMTAVQAQAQTAQAYLMLYDRLPEEV